ncbi:MAG: hypothetical protein JHC61_09225 [Burkholderiaceae bacterium]|nr:hypothetical protein [Burkholderiaceae bacterium]
MRSVVFFLCVVFSSGVFAQTVPNSGILYRHDTRPPTEIFKDGFRAWGNNADIGDHVSGESCSCSRAERGARDSAYVATTANRAFADELASRASNLSGNTISWVYEIRSNNGMYSAEATLRANEPDANHLIRIAAYQSEWIGVGTIRREDIRGAHIYANGRLSRWEPNREYYVERPPHINTGIPSDITFARRSNDFVHYAGINGIIITACMLTLPCLRRNCAD